MDPTVLVQNRLAKIHDLVFTRFFPSSGQQDPGLPDREANEVNQPVEVEGEGQDETLHQEENNAREEGGEEDGGPAYRDDQGQLCHKGII